MNTYLGFDTEFGSLDMSKNGTLLQAYFAVFDNKFNLVSELNIFPRPADNIYVVNPRAMLVNGIDLVEQWGKSVDLKTAKTQLYEFLSKARQGAEEPLIPVAQNMRLDLEYIWRDLMAKPTWDDFVSYRKQDTSDIARFLQRRGDLPYLQGCSLAEMVEYFKIEVDGEIHDAKYDTLATVEIYKRMLELKP